VSIRFDTVPALDTQTDVRTELVKQYRALYALHTDARQKFERDFKSNRKITKLT